MKKVVYYVLVFLASYAAHSQNPNASPFIEISYIRSKPSFWSIEKEIWKPAQQKLVKDQKLVAWYLYEVQYPAGTQKEYQFVSVNVYANWMQIENRKRDSEEAAKELFPKIPDLQFKIDSSQELLWRELLQLSGQAVDKESSPSKYIIVNQMKVSPGQEGEYVKMELAYFKPFHSARAELKIMNNWGLYKRNLPYGEKFEYDYITFNGYAEWADIVKNNPPDAWKKVHGDTDFNQVHNKILGMRATVNNELWKLVDSSL